MSGTSAAAYQQEKRERLKELKKKAGIGKPKSLRIKIQEMEKYDWNPAMRLLLLVLEGGTRREKEDYDDTWAPTGWTAEEMVGWCDMAQWRLAQRVGLTEDHINKMLKQLEEDGFIKIEGWADEETEKLHCRYRIIVEMVEACQRKEHHAKAQRGPRYKEGTRKANRGSFSKTNQPGISALRKKIMEQDDE